MGGVHHHRVGGVAKVVDRGDEGAEVGAVVRRQEPGDVFDEEQFGALLNAHRAQQLDPAPERRRLPRVETLAAAGEREVGAGERGVGQQGGGDLRRVAGQVVDVADVVVGRRAEVAVVHPSLGGLDVVGEDHFPAGPLEPHPREPDPGKELCSGPPRDSPT